MYAIRSYYALDTAFPLDSLFAVDEIAAQELGLSRACHESGTISARIFRSRVPMQIPTGSYNFV